MCDILVALPDSTASGRVIFGKNSDRPAGECQVLCSGPDAAASAGGIECAYVVVPRVPGALKTLGCRPYWCWGYETGINDKGVVGGNTAVFTRSRNRMADQPYGLLGMELLRFGLERGGTAERAVEVVTDLLERYGQWGPAVQGRNDPGGCYENAFVFADHKEAWLLETSGRRWVARRQREGTLALSNQLTIRREWTLASPDLEEYAHTMGWSRPDSGPLDFALSYSDHENYARQVSHIRWMRSRQLQSDAAPDIDVVTMKGFLRDHYDQTFIGGPQFSRYLPDFLTICMHDSPARFTWGNTATSVVVEIDPEWPVNTPYWACFQPPCTSVYAAFFLDSTLPVAVRRVGATGRRGSPINVIPDSFSVDSLWWRMRRILNGVREAPDNRLSELREEFDGLEHDFRALVKSIRRVGKKDRLELVEEIQRTEVRAIIKTCSKLEKEWKLMSKPEEYHGSN